MKCPICENNNVNYYAEKLNYKLYKCSSCTVIYVFPFPSTQALNEFYNNYHKTTQYTNKIDSKIKRAKKRISSLGSGKAQTFLDVGCNIGFAVEAARQLGYQSLGIDIDQDAINQAVKIFPSSEFRANSIFEVAEEGSCYDIIYSSEVIEHLIDPVDFLKQIYRVMGSHSKLFLTTPNVGHYSLPKHKDKLIKWTTFRPPEHLFYFNKKSIMHVFKRAGFKDVKIRFSLKPSLKVVAIK